MDQAETKRIDKLLANIAAQRNKALDELAMMAAEAQTLGESLQTAIKERDEAREALKAK